MKSCLTFYIQGLTKALALGACALLAFIDCPASAAPVTFSFTASGPAFGNPDAASQNFIAALGANPVVSGTFVYDSTSPFVSNGSNGVAIYGFAANITSSFASLTGSGPGFSFSDPRGFVTVGNNIPFGAGTSDVVEYYADNEVIGGGGALNFSRFTLGGTQIVDMRMFWSGDFLSNQDLPAAPPTFAGTLAFDIAAPAGSTSNTISNEAVFFTQLVVTPVPEPQTLALFLAGLGLMGWSFRRRANRG